MKTLRGLFFDLEHKAEIKTIHCKDTEDELNQLYNMLDCSLIDIAHYKIGTKEFDIVVDDEGLYKDPLIPSVIDVNGNILLVGKLFILNGNDESGELESLDDMDITELKCHTLSHATAGYEIICTGERSQFLINQRVKHF